MKIIKFVPLFSPFLLIACGKSDNSKENSNDYIVQKNYEVVNFPSRAQNERISSLIFHYTALNFENSLAQLTKNPDGVSAHWLIPDTGKKIYKLVDEKKRPYHAGVSYWKRRADLNDTSVGVEIVNLGFRCINNQNSDQCPIYERDWKPYTSSQIKLIIQLAKGIQSRYKIDPLCVVGHSDIAIGRKSDPGPLFPWEQLAKQGVGAWVSPEEISLQMSQLESVLNEDLQDLTLQMRLFEFGYDIKNPMYSDFYIYKSINTLLASYLSELSQKDPKLKEWKSIPFGNVSALNELNKKAKNFSESIFINSVYENGLYAFLMHYLPNDYFKVIEKRNIDSQDKKKILATIQALLIKYPARAKSNCGY